ncbi:AMP-binding protein [uncultured Roseibium sp.]|uniref:AMP-binding protein n=1 Tax=uncultured Roseibium sp. TaxID=1936171 RepID=UPI003217E68B
MKQDSLAGRVMDMLERRWNDTVFHVVSRSQAPLDLTGQTLHDRALQIGDHWRNLLGPGQQSLVIVLPAGESLLVTILAGLLTEGISLTFTAQPRSGSRTNHLAHVLTDSDASAVVCDEVSRNRILAVLAAAGHADIPVLAVDGAQPMPPLPLRRSDPNRTRPLIVQYTSGSTRAPKGVGISAENILANCSDVMQYWGMDADTRFVNWLPHYHDMGLMGGILYPLLSGAYSVQMSPFEMVRNPAFWLRTISETRATFSGGPAFAFSECLKRISDDDIDGIDLSSWDRAFCGAEPVPAGLLDAFHDRFSPYGLRRSAIFACFGLAEYTLFAAGAPETEPLPGDGTDRTHPCVVPGDVANRLKIVDPIQKHAMPEGETGEIWLSGPSVSAGYIGLDAETRDTFVTKDFGAGPQRWLRTGDLGVLRDKHLFINGRIKDLIIVNGRKIAAAELEWLAAQADATLNPYAAAAFQRDIEDTGKAVLLIECKTGKALPSKIESDRICNSIRRTVYGEWGIHLDEVRILRRGTLKRTTSGKIRRRVIAEDYRTGSPQHEQET